MPACTVVPSSAVSLLNACWSKTAQLQLCRTEQLLSMGPHKVKKTENEKLLFAEDTMSCKKMCTTPSNPHPNSEHVWADCQDTNEWEKTLGRNEKQETMFRMYFVCLLCLGQYISKMKTKDSSGTQSCVLFCFPCHFFLTGGVSAADLVPRKCNREAKNRCSTAAHSDRWNKMNLWRRCFQRTKHSNLVRTWWWANPPE